MRRTDEEFDEVKALCQTGLSDYEVARLCGVPRSTVQRWRRTQIRRSVFGPEPGWRPPVAPDYCHLLGVYLGDGWITTAGRSATLCVSLDKSYPDVVDETVSVIERTFPGTPVHRYTHRPGCVIVKTSHPSLPLAFPQYGPGRKHERLIELVPWQQELTRTYPHRLLRGLIHSDGCRCSNRFKTLLPSGRVAEYEYPRYFFSNLSTDIRRIFCEHCELLGIRWTQSSPRNVSVSDRGSVALLDSFVGPKR
ncbi:MAG: helix-turn-helix domain-containing protein [Actinomycetota bacterium]|nr:helix-turn-helix domain-containing protein [Actinomycetota bacterium]